MPSCFSSILIKETTYNMPVQEECTERAIVLPQVLAMVFVLAN